MRKPPFPIFDAHMHLDPEGRGVEAAREFQRAGGTSLLLVCKSFGSSPCRSPDDFGRCFDAAVEMAEKVRRSTGLLVLVAVGPHPAELPRLMGELGEERAREVMLGALERAGALVAKGRAHALGELGRPHFSVPPDVWAASNDVMEAGLRIAKELDCAAVLHTESATPGVFAELASIARRAGASLERVVKHFSPPVVRVEENHGIFPSVLASKSSFERALTQGTRFMLETDYIDDPKRPGAVLGPATVPRRTMELFNKGLLSEEQGWKIHCENPERVFLSGAR